MGRSRYCERLFVLTENEEYRFVIPNVGRLSFTHVFASFHTIKIDGGGISDLMKIESTRKWGFYA